MNRVLLAFLCLSVVNCTSKSKVTYKDMALPDDITPGYTAPTSITNEQWSEDRDILLLNLKKGYAGRFGLKKKILRLLHSDIEKIKGPMATLELCKKIAKAFDKVPDNHLSLTLQGNRCLEEQDKPVANGESLAHKKKKTWVVEKKNHKGKKILYISISGFPTHKSSVWRGFIKKVNTQVGSADLVVLDLRGNGGGDDTMGYRLSALFHKEKDPSAFPTSYGKQIVSQTPETITLKINSAKLGLRWKDEPKSFYEEWKRESEEMLAKALSGDLPNKKVTVEDEIPKTWKFRGYKLPIYILMDDRCGSSCESSIDSFEYNPYVKKVGRNTAGTLHFGNISSLFLKHSRLHIQTPTHANFFRDGRFIEKTGIKPDIEVPVGKDSFKYLKEKLL